MASRFEEIVAHVFSASDTSESVSMAEKIVEDNKKSKIESTYICSQSLEVNI